MPEKKYIDIRLHVTEDYDEIYKDTNYEVDSIEVHGTNLPLDALEAISESLAQMDKYQLMLSNDIPTAVWRYTK